jgi:hypothetical protein
MAEIVLQAALLELTEFLYATLNRFLSSFESCPSYKNVKFSKDSKKLNQVKSKPFLD